MDITDGYEGIVSSLTAPGSITSPSFVVDGGTIYLYGTTPICPNS
jgi:hypothetical protein